MDSLRSLLDKTRSGAQEFTEDVMNRAVNITIPLRTVLMSMMDMLGKTQGILTGSLFTLLGSYQTMQALMGAILELIIKILVAMSATIVGLWVVPFTWPAAAALSAVFLSVSIPLAIIAAFMEKVLHVHAPGIPGLPKKPRCFGAETELMAQCIDVDGSRRKAASVPILRLQPGDWIKGGSASHQKEWVQITGKFKLDARGWQLYRVRNALVTGSHLVYDFGKKKWIRVEEYEGAIPVSAAEMVAREDQYVYCLTTTDKEIWIDDERYTDWDEDQLDDDATSELTHARRVLREGNLFGYEKELVYSPDPEVKMYGIVLLRGQRWHALTNTGYFYIENAEGVRRCVPDYNAAV
jgi:hypothetical protein